MGAQMTKMKRCTKCNIVKPLDAFYKDSRARDGLTGHCKVCRIEAAAQYYKRFPERVKATGAQYRAKNAARIAARKAAYYRQNIDKRKGYNALYYREHAEQIKEHSRRYSREHPRLEQNRERSRRYRLKYPDRVKASHARQYAKHPERWTAYVHNRRTALCDIKLTVDILNEVIAASNGVCPYCGEPFEDGHIDHIIPVSKGGTNDRENLIYCCAFCNMSKHDKLLEDWLSEQRGRPNG